MQAWRFDRSPISAALLQMDGFLDLAGWQWMFIIEGIPAFLLGIVVFFYMTDRPEKAKWLPDDERAWLVDAMNTELASKAGHASHSIWRGLADLRVLALALIYSISEPRRASTRSASGRRRSSSSWACRR